MMKMKDVSPALSKKVNIVWIGGLFGILYWFFESLRDTYMYHKAPLFRSLIAPDSTSLCIRLFVVCMILLFSIHYLYLINRMKEKINGEARFLGIIGIVSSIIVFGTLYWILDSFQDVLIQVKGDMLKYIFSPGTMILWTRIFAIFFIVIFMFSIQYLVLRLWKIEIMKKDFLSLLTYQLKSPVVGIMGCIDNMLEGLTGDLKKEQKVYLELMQNVVSKNYRIISDLLNVTRIESSGISARVLSEPLRDCIESAVDPYRKQIEEKKLKLNLVEDKKDILVNADREKLVEAMRNILHNAIKFTDVGDITVHSFARNDEAIIEISDTGRGIPKAHLKKLFKKNQVFSGEPRPEHGLGLGLFVAKVYMKLQKGDISVKSTVGEGSSFMMTIPLALHPI